MRRLGELQRLVGADVLNRSNLTKPELHLISDRIDAALTGITGVSRRDRALVWLHEAIEEVAATMYGDFETSGAAINIPLQMFVKFNHGQVEQFPLLQGSKEHILHDGQKVMMAEVRYVGPALVAAARALRPGPRRAGSRPIPQKWVAFHHLVVAERLIAPMQPHDLKRLVLNAKDRLSKVRSPLDKG